MFMTPEGQDTNAGEINHSMQAVDRHAISESEDRVGQPRCLVLMPGYETGT